MEAALINALYVFYDATTNPDPRERDRAYLAEMRKLNKKYPDDPDVAALYAGSFMSILKRLEGEVIRDAMLAASGVLDPKMFGPGTLDESSKRRSVYFTMKRSRLIPSLIIFDAPDGTVGIGDRPATTIAPQALHLMNNPQVRLYARGLGDRMLADDLGESIRRGYRLTVSREPNETELKEGVEFVRSQAEGYQKGGKANAQGLALTDFAQVLLCLNEFVFVE